MLMTCLYVDNMLIFGTSLNIVKSTKLFLSTNFDMKNMGEINMILKVKVIRSEDCIIMSQKYYVERLLKKSIF